ncbi:MAG: hypothetical protein IKS75_08455 [Clostridiales bacterium]|nr:hypothetical protein [Clostridiales bacterium]
MNSNPKNSLDYPAPAMADFADNTILEVLQEKTTDNNSSKYVLIKHDYYSSDSDHGRDMLSVFLEGLSEASFNTITVYLVDKGTLLLDRSNPLYDKMQLLLGKAEMIIADNESIIAYGIDAESNPKIVIHSMRSIAEDLIYLPGILVLE